METNSAKGKGRSLKFVKYFMIAIGIIILLVIIWPQPDIQDLALSRHISDSTALAELKEKHIDNPENWSYTDDADRMTNKQRHFASCVSSNEIEFSSPYDGGSTFTLTLRNMGKGNEVVLQVSRGQFITSIMSSDYCRVKFDDGETTNYYYNSASDGSADVIFLANNYKFYNKLKNAKLLMIEAPFYQDGRQIINFNVEGLHWKY